MERDRVGDAVGDVLGSEDRGRCGARAYYQSPVRSPRHPARRHPRARAPGDGPDSVNHGHRIAAATVSFGASGIVLDRGLCVFHGLRGGQFGAQGPGFDEHRADPERRDLGVRSIQPSTLNLAAAHAVQNSWPAMQAVEEIVTTRPERWGMTGGTARVAMTGPNRVVSICAAELLRVSSS